jgi:hypothetical protein
MVDQRHRLMISKDGGRIGGKGDDVTFCNYANDNDFSFPVYSFSLFFVCVECRVRRVELVIEPGQSLGLMIRGGIEYGLGIYVTGVDKDSVADRAGLNVRTRMHFMGNS